MNGMSWLSGYHFSYTDTSCCICYAIETVKTQARRPPVGNSPKLLRRELDQHSATNQDSIPHGDISG